ncbi:Basement membrane-specific heparan sulfate proteoglycan core protein, variant 5 [Dermatophagoides farinae]|uniref:Basement membrane-specific heparan sulfate proteoglycan core protein, variant 5 n=1 Tax=Dermatophagoides farinae TaxID=6954 RepID=A0A922HTM2_DERFA|nr:Basement membrane-specific heparan sulfate proteoglycan core protein, variant 5 [Dermatophagoides farinae]
MNHHHHHHDQQPKCIRCRCHQHSDRCDPITGHCIDCQHNTSGNHCDRCSDGYYGDATLGTPDACRRCPCPSESMANNFSPTCKLDIDGLPTCLQCMKNYTGRNCEICNIGYQRNESIANSRCESIHLHQTIRVHIEGPKVKHVPAGSQLMLKCTGTSQISQYFNLDWIKLEGQLPPAYSEASGTLTIPNIQPEHGGTYVCSGFDLESIATARTIVIVRPSVQKFAPKVRIEPEYLEVHVGNPVTFKCMADGFPRPRLSWKQSQQDNKILNPSASFQPDTGIFYIPSAKKTDEAEYECHATNSAGSDSKKTVLFVHDYHKYAYVHVNGVVPTARVQPSTSDTIRGERVRFECNVTGRPIPSVRWIFVGGQSSSDSGGLDAGQLPNNSRVMGNVLTITNIDYYNNGVYTCIASNSYGTAEAQVRLSVNGGAVSGSKRKSPPVVSVEPARQTIVQGQRGELRCIASGNPRPTISWLKLYDQIDPYGRHEIDGDQLIIRRMEVEDRGIYICRAENIDGISNASAFVEIERRQIPSIEIDRVVLSEGSSTYFQCRVTGGIPEPTIEWRRLDGSPFTSNAQVNGGLLQFDQIDQHDEGVYVCSAENLAGRATAQTSLSMPEIPRVRILQNTPYRVRQNEFVRLECKSSVRLNHRGQPTKLNWHKLSNGHHNYYMNQTMNSERQRHLVSIEDNRATLQIQSVQLDDNGIYVCSLQSPMGNSEERIQLIVEQNFNSVPDVNVEEKVVTVAAGSRAELRCFVRGTKRNIIIKWIRADNVSLPDMSRVENGTLTIDQVKPQDSGDYYCLGYLDDPNSHQSQMLFKNRARLAVVVPPRIQIDPPLQTVRPGDTAIIDCVAVLDNDDDDHNNDVNDDNYYDYDINLNRHHNNHDYNNHHQQSMAQITWSRIDSELPTGIVVTDNVGVRRDDLMIDGDGDGGIRSKTITSRIIFHGIEYTDAGKYLCTAVNGAGRVEALSEIIVVDGRDPQNVREEVAILGANLMLRCPTEFVEPNEDLDIEWQFDSTNEFDYYHHHQNNQSLSKMLPNNVKIIRNQLHIGSVQMDHVGRYFCHVIWNGSLVEQNAIILTVKEPTYHNCDHNQFLCVQSGECIHIMLRCNMIVDCLDRSDEESCAPILINDLRIKADKDLINLDDSLELKCLLNGKDDPESIPIRWSIIDNDEGKNHRQFESNVHIDRNRLLIDRITYENGGVYQCSMIDQQTKIHANYLLVIQEPLPTSLIIIHEHNQTLNSVKIDEKRIIPLGVELILYCGFRGNQLADPLLLSFTWYKYNSSNFKQKIIIESTVNSTIRIYPNGTLIITNVSRSDTGTYVCMVNNGITTIQTAMIPITVLIDGNVPRFTQTPISFLTLPTLANAHQSLELTIGVKPEKPDGLILYNGGQQQQDGSKEDFISLGLRNYYVEFHFELGGGASSIRSAEPVTMDRWHLIRVTRNGNIGKLRVDDQDLVSTSSSAKFIGLDLSSPLYIGNVPDTDLSLQFNNYGFVGCISLFESNSQSFDLIKNATQQYGIGHCDICGMQQQQQCQNGGECRENIHKLEGYECSCQPGFSGDDCQSFAETCIPGICNDGYCREDPIMKFKCECPYGRSGRYCEQSITILEPMFNNGAYIALRSPSNTLNRFDLAIRIKPDFSLSSNQLLLYCGQFENGTGDYALLAIVNKIVEFRFDTGSGAAIIRSTMILLDHEWIEIIVRRNGRDAELQIEGMDTIYGRTPGKTIGLNLATLIYVGGYNRTRISLPNTVDHQIDHFNGCISQLKINDKNIDFSRKHIESSNLENCGLVSLCQRSPCLNNGNCLELNETTYRCICDDDHTGPHCERIKGICEHTMPCENNGECENYKQDSYFCHCPVGYSGTRCQHPLQFANPRSVRMNGQSYVRFDRSFITQSIIIKEDHHQPTLIEIRFKLRTFVRNALLAYDRIFLAALINDSHVQMTFDLGSGQGHVHSDYPIDDGELHHVVLRLKDQEGSLRVDENIYYGQSPGNKNTLNADGDIYFGGLPDFQTMTHGIYRHGFHGCLIDIGIGDSDAINIVNSSKQSRNLVPCDE